MILVRVAYVNRIDRSVPTKSPLIFSIVSVERCLPRRRGICPLFEAVAVSIMPACER